MCEDWIEKGNNLYDQEKYEEAIKCYDKALRIDPKNTHAWNNKGIALYGQGNYAVALECFDRALEIDPKYISAINNKNKIIKKQKLIKK